MAVAFGASGALGAAASGTSITPALPAGITAGQLLIGIVGTKNNATHTWPAGWTKQAQVNSGASWTVSWATLQASGSDSAPTVSWSGSVANTGIIGRWTGADLQAPIGAVGTAGTGTVSPHTSAAITTLRDNSLCIYLDSCAVATAITVPSGYATEINSTSATSATVISTGDKTVATHGTSTGAISTAGGAAAWVQWQIEIMSPAPLSTGRVPFADQYAETVSIPNWASDSISIPPIMRAMALGPPPTSHIPRAPQYALDPGWVGTPQEAETLIIAAMTPTPVTYMPRAPLYVPKPDQTASIGWAFDPWMWGPLTVGLPLNTPKTFSNRWSNLYTFEPDKIWLGMPTDNPPLWQLNKPFAKPLWRWDFEPDKVWLGTPIGTDPLYFPAPPPLMPRAPLYVPRGVDPGPWQQYSDALNILLAVPPAPLKVKQWRYDYEPDKYWQGTPTSNLLPWQLAEPFSNRRYLATYEPDRYWTWSAPGSNTVDLLTSGGVPFSKQWRWDFEPDKLWQGTPDAAATLYIPKPQPLNKQLWRYDLITDTWWQGVPTANLIPQQLAQPFSKQWRWDYDVEAPNKWQGSPVGSNTINALTSGGAPFFKQWRYDLDWDKYWQGSPQPTNIRFFPFVEPFSKQWEYNLEPDKYWQGSPIGSNTINVPTINPAVNKWAALVAWDSGQTLWQRYSLPALSLETLVEGGAPFFKQWRWDFEPDKYWQGSPQPTNIRMFPFAVPFGKQWRYDLEFDKYWQGISQSPSLALTSAPATVLRALFYIPRPEWDKYWQGSPVPTNLRFFPFVPPFHTQWRYDLEFDKLWQGSPVGHVTIPPITPFSKRWRYDFETDKHWQRYSLPAISLNMLTEGGRPFSKQWRYDFHIEQPLWLGSPITAALQGVTPPTAVPTARAPFWAPRPEWDKLWQGTPIATGIGLFPTAVPSPTKLWRYSLITDTLWQWEAPSSQTLASLVEGGVPFHKQWRYDFEPDKYWQRYSWPAASLNMLVEGGVPISNEWFIQYTFDQEAWGRWQGTPKTAYSIYLIPIEPPHNEWYKQYEFDSGQTLWQWAGTSAAALTGLAVAGKPFFQQWRYDFVPSPDWEFTSQPSDTLWIHTMGGKPTFKQWRYDFEPDKYWQGSPIQTNIRFFPFVVPFSNEWSALYTLDSGLTYWQGTPTAPYTGRIGIQAPFSNEWTQQYWWDSGATFWLGTPIATNIRFIPFVEPFANEWSSLSAWDSGGSYWQGKPTGPFAPMIALPPPFFKSWSSQYTWDSGATYWQGSPLSVNLRTFPFVLPFSNEWAAWSWDSGATFWQGRPFNLLASGERIPIVPPRNLWGSLYTQDSDLHLWRFSDYVRQNAVITFKFRVFPFSGAYLKETIDIPPFWQGHPTYLPPFLINVAVAVFNPDDMLPRFGHPLFPRRKDPLFLRGDDLRRLAIPDEPLFPRRKDPLK